MDPHPPTLTPRPSKQLTPINHFALDIVSVVTDTTRRLASNHARHFLGIAVFLLSPPSTLLTLLLPIPFATSFTPRQSLLLLSTLPSPSFPIFAAIAIFITIFYLSAVAAVAVSVKNGFFGRPVKLRETFLKIPASLARLLVTLIAGALPFAALASLLFLALHLAPSYHAIHVSLAAVTAVIAVFLFVNFSLAGAVSIVEGIAGFLPLYRSYRLLTGFRWAAFFLLVFFVSCVAVMTWAGSLGERDGMAGDWTDALPVVVTTVLGSAVVTALLLYGLVANSVLYMDCRLVNGELDGEIAEEFAGQYVRLPFDDKMERHVVTVVQP